MALMYPATTIEQDELRLTVMRSAVAELLA
jgi:hypothetical protein